MVVKLTIFDKPNVVFYFDSENIFSQNNQTRSNECRDQISKLNIDEKRSFISMYVQVRSKKICFAEFGVHENPWNRWKSQDPPVRHPPPYEG